MSAQSVLRSPNDVAQELNISPATLRRWSQEFVGHLSQKADSDQNRSHRRYTNSDIATLHIIKELMSNGMTYEHVRQHLNGKTTVDVEPDDILQESSENAEDTSAASKVEKINNLDDEPDNDEEWALVASDEPGSQAISFLTNTLTTLSDSQKSILNSQAANRELLGVLLQDNFNLKEENNRLRERILEVERDVAQNRQEEEWRREALRQELETKISATNQVAMDALATAQTVEPPEIKAVESKSGCLGMLFGSGSTQIVSVPKRRPKASARPQHVPPPGTVHSQPSSLPEQPAQNHPKPMFPPE
jgi:DNA-binding transcriptional MerR regulator